MVTTVTALTVVVGLLIGAVVALAGRLSGAVRKLDAVEDRCRVNASTIEMRTRPRDAEGGVADQVELFELQRQ